MENATKGLMIAGAILIAIVLISLGVFLVQRSQSSLTEGIQQLDDNAVMSFNSKFENYSGRRNGSDIRALINLVNNNNLSAASNGTYAENGIDLIVDAEASSTGKEITVEGKVKDYDSITATQARNAINTGKTYYVSLGYDNTTRLVDIIGIATEQSIADGLVSGGTNQAQ